jgi:F-type H+-transporting ATPase subunit a
MYISTDEQLILGSRWLNATIFFSWCVMGLLITIALLLQRQLREKKLSSGEKISNLQIIFEIIFEYLEGQIKNSSSNGSMKIIFPFVGTLFLYILTANLLSLLPFCESPTASLSTTVALALLVFVLTLGLGVNQKKLGYFKKYLQPVFLMLPINIIGDISRVVSLAVRLYGNLMSGYVVMSIFTSITFLSLGLPVFLGALSIISGVVQAYIFSALTIMFLD